MAELDDLVREFLVESSENLDRLDQDFVALEKDPTARERLASIFRTIHTIKGTCGFLGFGKLESVTHIGENVLAKLRDGVMSVDSEIVTALLRMVDAVREILASIETGAGEGNGDYTGIIAELTRLNANRTAPHPPVAASTEAAPAPAAAPPAASTPEPVAAVASAPATTAASAPTATAEEPEHAEEAEKAPPAAAGDAKSGEPSAANSGLRVDVGLLDRLMNLVGELVLARNQILQYSTGIDNATLSGSTQRLNLITTELQEGVMKTRMQPIGNVWGKFPRVVRDVAQNCGKRVRVEMEGKDTELDKTIIEAIKDPLTHIIRNSVDHGIESPEKRKAANKPEEGVLFLRAFHEGGQVNIEIRDDGAGVNVDRVKKKAIEKGLISAEQAARMSDREAVNMIWLPGFSTAEKVTNVSGRGVGMDVVKTNIEKIGGSLDLQSKSGEGTTIRIRIPLTLAIIPALIISSGNARFAIPQVSLLELVRLEGNQVRTGIEMIENTPVHRLRGNLLPLVYLSKELKTPLATVKQPGTLNAETDETRSVNIVVLQADNRQFGLVVDEINDTEEIVVKPLSKVLKGLTTFAGATIMGDGRVALILDVMGLAHGANVVAEHKEENLGDAEAQEMDAGADRQTLLVFQLGEHRRMAVPLGMVARLEELPRNSIEHSGGLPVVQYRGQIMPLITLSEFLGEQSLRVAGDAEGPSPNVQVIVYSRGTRSVGLVVDRIVDIVEQVIEIRSADRQPGVLGSAVIDRKVTQLLDVEGVVSTALPERGTVDHETPLAA